MNTTKEIVPAVAAIIFNEKGEVLMQKRKDVNKWCILSGHVEFGETVENAVLREIKEETDTDATIVRFIGIYSSPGSQTYFYPGKTVQYVTSYFEAQLSAPLHPGFTNEETRELKFFAVDQLPSELALINPHWLADALHKKEIFIR